MLHMELLTSKEIGTLISISTLRSRLLLVPLNFEASESHMFKDCKLWLIYWFGSFSLSGLVSYCHVVFGLNLLVLPKECPAFGFGLDGQWWYQLHVPSVLNCIVILVSD
jgi:hypothetical protein